MARESMRQIMTGVETLAGSRPRRVANNTIEYTRPDGCKVIRLHHTDIVTFLPDGSKRLNDDGWITPTTKDRLNRYAGTRIYSHRGQWYLADGIPYYDGVVIGPNGELPAPKLSIVKANAKLAKAINKLVAKVALPLPMPNAGDCWLCGMRDVNNGQTLGEDDKGHLLSHIEEGYLHGSLIYNAMQWAGYRDHQIALHFQGIVGLTSIKSALRRYLRRKLGIG